jgi:hypothetical protein
MIRIADNDTIDITESMNRWNTESRTIVTKIMIFAYYSAILVAFHIQAWRGNTVNVAGRTIEIGSTDDIAIFVTL